MKTSARNQLAGLVTAVTDGAVNSEVALDLGGGEHLVAIISKDSVARLGLVPGSKALALVKASWPILALGALPTTSARNHLAGRVVGLHHGAVNTEVVLKLAGGAELVVMITAGSEQALALKVGDSATALIKASHVILAVE